MPLEPSYQSNIYVPQTTPFTCGPAAGLMALKLAKVLASSSWADEFQIWREANSVYMGSGQAGCEPHGLAASLRRRGARVLLWEHATADLFDVWSRRPDMKAVARFIRSIDRSEAAKLGVEFLERPFSTAIFLDYSGDGWVPIVLSRDGRTLHWVTVQIKNDSEVRVLDPYQNGSPDDIPAPPKQIDIPHKDIKGRFTHRRGTAHAVIFVRATEAEKNQ